MRALGRTLVVATSAKREELAPLLAVAGISDLVDGATSSDDAVRSKPDPDIARGAIARSGFDADQLVMLGDTPYDVEAATRAGGRVAAFRCGGWNDRALVGAAAVYDGPADLLNRYARSILAR